MYIKFVVIIMALAFSCLVGLLIRGLTMTDPGDIITGWRNIIVNILLGLILVLIWGSR